MDRTALISKILSNKTLIRDSNLVSKVMLKFNHKNLEDCLSKQPHDALLQWDRGFNDIYK